ncbi:DUF5677 domain-containing protein [Shewanella sp. JNE10-2]|uniref:DUF5677 domain-containing protein n=1 Tax=unclassified Shewanella TaxID=196818 RepID=UPI002005178D|nr:MULTISPECIES: DUF5677 domain-containing protein [unclassified Shewanella]MCK7630988.1 DUF5677 domain-containing protein [Shewanella sp. JNE9-1]MCK7646241.1 DUF5677 domain-containing protein [Shewanella sp. JNE3-1]MCK7654196.1 DUF5677 domain-containing protein [Shewanella sp. JNE4-1]UPO28055.1 DUF5677 domain-containing protein [Shewanella sp. JNE10-2]UPO35262.1 DUF5677 domain-containing protein [Shewanella sp. JNE7]
MNNKSDKTSGCDIDELIVLVDKQRAILANPIMLMLKKKITYDGQVCEYAESPIVANVIVQLFNSCRATTTSIITLAKLDGMYGKDCLLLARGVIETCINATYIMSGGDMLAQAALNHSYAKAYSNLDRQVGEPEYGMRIRRTPSIILTENGKSFMGDWKTKRGLIKNWTDDSVPSRVKKSIIRLVKILLQG